MLNKKQYKVLSKFIKQIKTDFPDRQIIFSTWTINLGKLSKKENEILLTISHSPIELRLNKFGLSTQNSIYIDNHTFDLLNEYKENHNWRKMILEIVGFIICIRI